MKKFDTCRCKDIKDRKCPCKLLNSKIPVTFIRKKNDDAFKKDCKCDDLDAPIYNYVQTILDGDKIPKWIETIPDIQTVDLTDEKQDELIKRTIVIEETAANVLPTCFKPPDAKKPQKTWIWRYRDIDTESPCGSSFIGPLVIVNRGTPLEVHWENRLTTGAETKLFYWPKALDQTLHWANVNGNPPLESCGFGDPLLCPQENGVCSPRCDTYLGPIPHVTHLHGAEVRSSSDGHPDSWYTKDLDKVGLQFGGDRFRYENAQEPTGLWFHDHTLGITRLNVYAGLAGYYFLVDPNENLLPCGLTQQGLDRCGGHKTDVEAIPLVIQDRTFDTKGQLYYPFVAAEGIQQQHPRWTIGFTGNVNVVNGRSWPTVGTKYKPLDRARYRFLLLNGANLRVYNLWLSLADDVNFQGPPIWIIGTDGGYLDNPIKVERKTEGDGLLILPAERYSIIVDFDDPDFQSRLKKYKKKCEVIKLILRNDAVIAGNGFQNIFDIEVAKSSIGQVVKFYVNSNKCIVDNSYNPANPSGELRKFNKIVPLRIPPGVPNPILIQTENIKKVRRLVLNIRNDPPIGLLLNNSKFFALGQPPDLDGNFVPERAKFTEDPVEQTTEIWEFYNLTGSSHPMHIHLVDFQLLNRQELDRVAYRTAWANAYGAVAPSDAPWGCGPPGQDNFGDNFTEFDVDNLCERYLFPGTPSLDYPSATIVGGNPDPSPYLGGMIEPNSYELGLKDTIHAPPNAVTRIIARFSPGDSPIDDPQPFPINVSGSPGYIWHCHFLDHEDNEMMRRMRVLKKEIGPCP